MVCADKPLVRAPSSTTSPLAATKPDRALSRLVLPHTVGADQRDHFAFVYVQRDVAHGGDAAVCHCETRHVQEVRSAHAVPRYAATTAGSLDTSSGVLTCDQPAGIEYVDAIAQRHDKPHVVFDQENADAVVSETSEDAAELFRLDIVHAGGRFVEQHERGRSCDSAHDFNAALVTVRELAGGHGGEGPHSEAVGNSSALRFQAESSAARRWQVERSATSPARLVRTKPEITLSSTDDSLSSRIVWNACATLHSRSRAAWPW